MSTPYSLNDLARYFLRLGTFGFGGAIALAHAMQAELVEKRQWITKEQFLRGLTLSQLAPGPVAAQLAMYIGFVKAGTVGATVAGIAFIFPSFLMVLTISAFYVHFGALSSIQGALYGVSAAVIGVIIASGYTLTKRMMVKKLLLWVIYGVTFIVTVFTGSASIFVFLCAGVISMLVYTKERLRVPKAWAITPILFSTPGLLSAVFSFPLAKLFLFFLMAGAMAFGGGFAIIPFLHHGAVTQYQWLTPTQFSDAVAIAMITPGPVVIAATFIGYLTAQVPGAMVATIAIFLPVYLIVIFLTPLFTRHAEHPHMVAFVEGVIAAAMAAVAGSVIILGETSITDRYTLGIAIASLLATKQLKVPGIVVIALAAAIGVLIHH